MRCPFCGEQDTNVKDSRASEDGTSVRRRRNCSACSSRFTTFERVQVRELYVFKKNGQKRPFEREKVIRSISLATRKRDINMDKIEMIVNRVIYELEEISENLITTAKVGELVMENLLLIDKVSYMRYASVYKQFRELEDFKNLLTSLSSKSDLLDI